MNWPWMTKSADRQTILALQSDVEEMKQRMQEEKKDPEKVQPAIYERVADLEVKMNKLWGLVVEASPSTGKERLNKHGRRLLGGKASLFGKNQAG